MKIMDISQFNKVTDFKKAAASVDGIIFRIGYRGYCSGTLVRDARALEYMHGCIGSGKPWGAYFVSQAISKNEAIGEADFCYRFLKLGDLSNCSLGVWFDSEKCEPKGIGRGDNIHKSDRTQYALEFVKYISAFGLRAGVYCSDSWLNSQLVKSAFDCPLWLARYGGKKPGNACDMWQYTSSGTVPGVNGNVDLSECYFLSGDLPSLKGYKGFSIVDGLRQFGYDSSFKARKQLAARLGISNYKGTSKQNMQMLDILKNR